MHLAHRLLTAGHEIVGIDNFNPYYAISLKEDRHKTLESHPRYTGIRMDLCDRHALETCFKEHAVERVCHLAAQAGVRYSLTHPHVYEESNVQAFLNMLECCRHHAVQRLVYASSSSVYGGNTKLPFREADTVDAPVSLYAATKKANELMAHCYTHLYGFQTIGLRFFTVYGPWGRPDMAMWLFTKAMLEKRPIKVFNHGKMQRDFTYIDDIITGVERSLLQNHNLDPYEILNIGNHRSENLMEMIDLLAHALGCVPQMEMLPMQPGDVPATYADITQIQQKLDFAPSTPIAEGIPKFVDWFLAYHQLHAPS